MDELSGILRRAYPAVLSRVLARLRDLASAEDAVQEAVARALESWPGDGRPDAPEAWLVRVAVNSHIDGTRRAERTRKYRSSLERLATQHPWSPSLQLHPAVAGWNDDMLRLLVTCCDPVLGLEERTALALATVGGLTSAEIARAFMVAPLAMVQRLTRARKRLRERRRDYQVPGVELAPERLQAVLAAIHFCFNEGYWSTSGAPPIRKTLTRVALSMAGSLAELLPGNAEVRGLHALLVFHEARVPARVDENGTPVDLERQDRSKWDQRSLSEARRILDAAIALGPRGPYQIEAAIAAVHCAAADAEDTDWLQIAALYSSLESYRPSPVVRVNRAFALGRAVGESEGLRLLETVADDPSLGSYPYMHLVRGSLLAECGRTGDALESLERALACSSNHAERAQIRDRLAALRGKLS